MTSAPCAIIFVPGIRAKPPAKIHADWLRQCAALGARRAGATEAEAAAIAATFDLVGWSAEFYGLHADITPDLPGIERLLSEPGDPAADRRDATAWSRRMVAMFYAVGDRLPVLSRMFTTHRMRTRLRDIDRYFDDEDGAGSQVRARLSARIEKAWQQQKSVMLIGHSFGSVIAYDTLWELSHTQAHPGHVELFLTLGSPLTLSYICSRLHGADAGGQRRFPTNIRRWHNITAVGEVAAQDRRVSDVFGAMQTLGLLDALSDNLDMLNSFRGPEGLNPHKCYGYFANPSVGEFLVQHYRQFVTV